MNSRRVFFFGSSHGVEPEQAQGSRFGGFGIHHLAWAGVTGLLNSLTRLETSQAVMSETAAAVNGMP
jgi:hypothetical protein